jgi:predicted GIY-YIG superfamily endonuclease
VARSNYQDKETVQGKMSPHHLVLLAETQEGYHNLVKLVYYEIYEEVHMAIAREKQIKGGSRKDKIELVNKMNKDWEDLVKTL